MDHFELKLRRYANGILVCPLLNYLLEVDLDEVVLVLIVMVVEEDEVVLVVLEVVVREEEVEVEKIVVEEAEKNIFVYSM